MPRSQRNAKVTLRTRAQLFPTQAQFAALCRVAPISDPSGKMNRHRLSRGGDRQANRALPRIVLIRMRFREPRTMAYFARRRAEGLADRDIIRCLKRHIVNEVFALLTHPSIKILSGPSLRPQRQLLGIRLSDDDAALGALPTAPPPGAGHPHRPRPRPPPPALARRDRPTTPQNPLTPIGTSRTTPAPPPVRWTPFSPTRNRATTTSIRGPRWPLRPWHDRQTHTGRPDEGDCHHGRS
ncbi:transposase [Kocuria sp. M1N1S27]|uniref:transposase n=1 Tax=Kocuria kalidii TaxID=3376283 RepID=UPI0037A84C50